MSVNICRNGQLVKIAGANQPACFITTKETVLYEGNSKFECTTTLTSYNTEISLLESISNYDEIKIYYANYSDAHDIDSGIKCDSYNSSDIMKILGRSIYLNEEWTYGLFNIDASFIDGETLALNNGILTYKNGATETSFNGVNIYRITGIKTV